MKPVYFLVNILAALFFTTIVINAQPCIPITVTSSTAVTASCPAGGSITVVASGTGLSYKFISGPAGYSSAPNSTGIFNSLSAGTYIVEIEDDCGVKQTLSKTITNTYPVFSVNNAVSSNMCTSGVQGGTITATVTGGKLPYQYDIVPVASTPTYGANTSSTTYVETVNTFGTFRVYSKDACGEVRTYDIILEPTQPVPADFWWEELVLDNPCGETMDGLPTIKWKIHLLDENGIGINFNELLGATYQIYKPSPANSITNSSLNGDCTVSTGALLTSGTIIAANIPADDVGSYAITIPQEDVIFVFTNKCGHTLKYCFNFNQGNPITPNVEYSVIQESCGSSWNTQTLNITKTFLQYLQEPVSFLLTKYNNSTETNGSGWFYGLSRSDFPLTISATDACGRVVNKTLDLPTEGSALSATAEPEWNFTCTNINNTASARIKITGGDLPGIATATNVVITGGTVTAVPTISSFKDWLPGYYVSNLLAGYSYKIMITNLCGEKDSILFTVPVDHWGQPVLSWNLTATANSLCGQSIGTVKSDANFSGTNGIDYYLYNLSAPNTVVASNNTGIFQNVNAGNYKVKFVIPGVTWLCADKEIKDSVNVTVLSAAGGQNITNKTITTCETSGGVPLTTGKALINVNGSAPFTYEIIKTSLIGTGASEIWNVASSNNPSSTYAYSIPLGADPATTIYTLRSTDHCGNKITTQANLQPISPLTYQANVNPCVADLNYSLRVNAFAGDFTYRWVKLPDVATTLGVQPTLTFAGNYSAVNDGTYRCFATLPGCVERTVDVKISSASCGIPLPIKLLSFTGQYNNNITTLKWITENQINFSHFEIERSITGIQYEKIGTIFSGNKEDQTEYSLTDNLSYINTEKVFYRLKIADRDGKYSYSNVVKINTSNKQSVFSIYPNPAKDYTTLSVNSSINTQALIRVTDNSGKTLLKFSKELVKGSNTFSTPALYLLAAGTYVVEVITNEKTERSKLIKM